MSSDSSGKTSNQRTRAFLAVGTFVVLAAVVAGVLVVRSRSATAGTVDPLVVGGPSASETAGGLTITLRLSPGPYFLGELVAAEASIANHSQTTYTLQGFPRVSLCGSAVNADLKGDGATYKLPTTFIAHCALGETSLHPGDALNILQLIPISASDHVTVSAEARFIVPVPGQDHTSTSTSAPFTNGFPTVHISVSQSAPADHTITLRPSGQQVTISAPSGARDHLYYQSVVTCDDTTTPGAGSASFNGPWIHITSTTLGEPTCSGTGEVWKYSVGAPGYAIASGVTPPGI